MTSLALLALCGTFLSFEDHAAMGSLKVRLGHGTCILLFHQPPLPFRLQTARRIWGPEDGAPKTGAMKTGAPETGSSLGLSTFWIDLRSILGFD